MNLEFQNGELKITTPDNPKHCEQITVAMKTQDKFAHIHTYASRFHSVVQICHIGNTRGSTRTIRIETDREVLRRLRDDLNKLELD